MRLVLLTLTLIGAAGPATAAERPPTALYQQWLKDMVGCRGGGGSQAATDAACEHRNIVDRKMAAAGWCYGRPDEFGVNADWHRCGR